MKQSENTITSGIAQSALLFNDDYCEREYARMKLKSDLYEASLKRHFQKHFEQHFEKHFEQAKKQVFKRGIEQGIERGVEETLSETINGLLGVGMPISKISLALKRPEGKIEELIKKHKLNENGERIGDEWIAEYRSRTEPQ
jgi:flagellar biosynthesis/type III secretory pathway protein FliH